MSRDDLLFMCLTDYDYELGEASGGTPLYASIEDLKECRPCVEDCGIVAVRVEFVEIVQPAKPYKDWRCSPISIGDEDV